MQSGWKSEEKAVVITVNTANEDEIDCPYYAMQDDTDQGSHSSLQAASKSAAHAENYFYTLGKPIDIKSQTYAVRKLFDRSLQLQLRDDITPEEIINSFPETGDIFLFRTHSDAALCAKSRLAGNFYTGAFCRQAAVFKVLYTNKPDLLQVESHDFSFIDQYKHNKQSSSGLLEYFLTDVKHVIPLVAYLKLDFVSGARKDYPEVVMSVTNTNKGCDNTEKASSSHLNYSRKY